DSRNRKQQAENYTCTDVGGSAHPFAFFEHFGSFPAETGKGGVAAKEADGDGDAPVGGNDHAVQSELADEAEEETSGEVDEQRAVRKSSAHADLYDALQAVACERADGAEEGNQEDFQHVPLSFRGSANKKLLAPHGSQE